MNYDTIIQQKTFCPLPFIRQTIFQDGSYKVCCYAGGSELGTDARTYEVDNQTYFNSRTMQRIRHTLLTGEYPPECRDCQEQVDKNLTPANILETRDCLSMPDTTAALNAALDDYFSGSPITPTTFDIRYSNVCNLKCQMCNQFNSSAIYAENRQLGLAAEDELVKQRSRHELIINYDKSVWMYFAGGEPFLEEFNIEMLENLTDSCRIAISTNLTVLTPRVVAALGKFSDISLMVSIDAIGELNDYIRSGSRFNDIVSNLQKVKEQLPNVRIDIGTTVSLLNVMHLAEFVQHVKTNYPGVKHHFMTVVHQPHLYIETLPVELRSTAITSLERCRVELPEYSEYFSELIGLLSDPGTFNPAHFQQLIKIIKQRDQLRSTDVTKVIPLLSQYFGD